MCRDPIRVKNNEEERQYKLSGDVRNPYGRRKRRRRKRGKGKRDREEQRNGVV